MGTVLKIVVVLSVFGSLVSGQKIYLSKSFFTGYKYSVDSVNYESIDTDKMKDIMNENNEAIELLDKYSTYHTLSIVTGIPGGFLVGWPLGGYLGSGGDWKDGYTAMLVAGGGLTILSFIFDSTANNSLEESIEMHNNHQLSLIESFNINLGYCSKKEVVMINVIFHF